MNIELPSRLAFSAKGESRSAFTFNASHSYNLLYFIHAYKASQIHVQRKSTFDWLYVHKSNTRNCINTTSEFLKLVYITAHEIWDNFEISRVVFKPNITYKSCYLFILPPEKFSIVTPSV